MTAVLHRTPPRSVFFLIFTASGFAGLIYESIWSHYLKLFLGHAAYAQALVLALFMGGMAAGSWICSRCAGRWKNLLAAYAWAEAAIGLAALGFHPVFVSATDWAYASLLPRLGSDSAAFAAKWVLAGLLIVPQSVLLGMTFPLMSAGLLRRHPLAPGATIAMLYFTNSIGAAAGVLASGLLMIGRLGLPGTLQAAGAMNLALAVIVIALARSPEPAPARRTPARGAGNPAGLLLAVAGLTGAASFVYEIGWIRMLSLVLGASTHSFELMLAAFILGLALGGLWVRRRIDGWERPALVLGVVQVAMGLAALATIPVYSGMFEVMSALVHGLAKTETGHALFLGASQVIALAIMFPATFCAGMTLPLITCTLLRGGRGESSIGAVYAANTLGSIAGVILAVWIGLPFLGVKGLVCAGAALDVALGLVLLVRIQGAGRPFAAAAAAALAAFIVVPLGFPLDSHKMASGVFRRGEIYDSAQAKMIFHRDGRTATVSLVDFPEGRSLRTNGKSDGAIALDPEQPRISDEITMVLTAAIPMAIKPEARRVAVIGIGTGLTTHTLLANPALEEVETIEIEPLMAEASRGFAPRNSNAFADPRSRLVFEDAKTYFSTGNRSYDIIISEPSNPWVSGVASLFSIEFYRLAKRHLNPGGVLAQWFQLYEIGPSLVASVLTALGAEFPDYAVYATTNGDLLIVAGSPEALARPLADIVAVPAIAQELRKVEVHSMGDIELRRLGGKRALAPLFASYGAPANSDYYPYLDLNAARHRFLQRHAGQLTEIGGAPLPLVAMLEGRAADWTRAPSLRGADYFEKIDLLRQAYRSRAILQGSASATGESLPGQLRQDLALIRANPLECERPESFDVWFHARFRLATSLLPLLPASQAYDTWTSLPGLPCRKETISPAQAAWLDLLASAAARDAERMAQIGERLLEAPLPHSPEQRRYLLMAAMGGHLALGRRESAAALWHRYGGAADPAGGGDPSGDSSNRSSDNPSDDLSVNLRLLYAHAFPGSVRPGAR